MTTTSSSPLDDLDDEAALRAITEGTATETGERFFYALVDKLASTLKTHGFAARMERAGTATGIPRTLACDTWHTSCGIRRRLHQRASRTSCRSIAGEMGSLQHTNFGRG